MDHGALVISLDFELIWGMIDKITSKDIIKKVNNVKEVVPKILNLFKTYEIHATWAVVGLITSSSKEEIIEHLKNIKVNYHNESLKPSNILDHIHQLETSLLCNIDLVKSIQNIPHQEIGSHSFSHFYSLEKGQTDKDFINDIITFNEILEQKLNVKATSYIDPRFQHNASYDKYLTAHGFKTYRGIREDKLKQKKIPDFLKRWIKFLDRYVNILGHRTYSIKDNQKLLNMKESFYFRGYKKHHFMFEWLKIKRIKKAMLYAAKHHEIIHIWWHPHDFGLQVFSNINQLHNLLMYFTKLKKRYDMKSYHMDELCMRVKLHDDLKKININKN